MKGRVIFGNPPPLPAPANAISRTATRPKTCAGLGNLRGVPKARVCMREAVAPRRGETGYYHLSAEGHMRLHQRSWIRVLGVAALSVPALLGARDRNGGTAQAQTGPTQAAPTQCTLRGQALLP